MAELPPDLSPLQIGTRGEWKGRTFELLGRIRVEWAQGSWNEWYAAFSDGVAGWVAEAQGFYMVSFETKDRNIPQTPKEIPPGNFLRLAGRTWSITDIKTVRCRAGEGELPFRRASRIGAEKHRPNRQRRRIRLARIFGRPNPALYRRLCEIRRPPFLQPSPRARVVRRGPGNHASNGCSQLPQMRGGRRPPRLGPDDVRRLRILRSADRYRPSRVETDPGSGRESGAAFIRC